MIIFLYHCVYLSVLCVFSSSAGQIVAVGAPGDCSSSQTINGPTAQNCVLFPDVGAVFIYARIASVYQFVAYLKASNSKTSNLFGTSVALSADGKTCAVGAVGENSPSAGVGAAQTQSSVFTIGAVYVFIASAANASVWTQSQYVKPDNAQSSNFKFGASIALTNDGLKLIVGASNERGASAGINGNSSQTGPAAAGAAYLFVRSDSNSANWTQEAYFKASNNAASLQFGASVAISADGSHILVGADLESGASR